MSDDQENALVDFLDALTLDACDIEHVVAYVNELIEELCGHAYVQGRRDEREARD